MTNQATKLIHLGKNIKKARQARGYFQNELADLLDISREHLAKVETAKRTISLKLLFRLCDILEKSENELFNFNI